jgi:hypothetical protein
MSVLYDKNGVYIDDSQPATLRFGHYSVPTKSSNRGGDTVLRDKGLNSVVVKAQGLFSSKHDIVFSYYYPEGAADEVVWTAESKQEAEQIAAAIRSALK